MDCLIRSRAAILYPGGGEIFKEGVNCDHRLYTYYLECTFWGRPFWKGSGGWRSGIWWKDAWAKKIKGWELLVLEDYKFATGSLQEKLHTKNTVQGCWGHTGQLYHTFTFIIFDEKNVPRKAKARKHTVTASVSSIERDIETYFALHEPTEPSWLQNKR